MTQYLEGRERVLGRHAVERFDNNIVITALVPSAIAADLVEELGRARARALIRDVSRELEMVW